MPCITFIQWWFRQVRQANWTIPLRVAVLNPLPNAQTYPLPSFEPSFGNLGEQA